MSIFDELRGIHPFKFPNTDMVRFDISEWLSSNTPEGRIRRQCPSAEGLALSAPSEGLKGHWERKDADTVSLYVKGEDSLRLLADHGINFTGSSNYLTPKVEV